MHRIIYGPYAAPMLNNFIPPLPIDPPRPSFYIPPPPLPRVAPSPPTFYVPSSASSRVAPSPPTFYAPPTFYTPPTFYAPPSTSPRVEPPPSQLASPPQLPPQVAPSPPSELPQVVPLSPEQRPPSIASTYYHSSPEHRPPSPPFFSGHEWNTPQSHPPPQYDDVSDNEFDILYDPDDVSMESPESNTIDHNIDLDNFDDDTVEFNPRVFDEMAQNVNHDTNDDDDEVIFVNSYYRPNDVMPSIQEMKLIEAREHMQAAKQQAADVERILQDRVERTSCGICSVDFLEANPLRMPCNHVCCRTCLEKIVQYSRSNFTSPKCPFCREDFINVETCGEIIFL